LRAVYPLRTCKPRLRTYSYGYRDAEACIADLLELHARPRSEHVLGFLTPASDGKWMIILALGKEFAESDELRGDPRAGLARAEEFPTKDAPLWSETGIPGHVFFRM